MMVSLKNVPVLLKNGAMVRAAGEDGDRCSHPRRQRSPAEVSVEMTQLTLAEVPHLQCLEVVEIGEP